MIFLMVLTKISLGFFSTKKINDFSLFSVTWGPNGNEKSFIQRYCFQKSLPNVFKLVLIFPLNGPHQTTLGIFKILSFRFLAFFRNI